jgi:hypothetical protein
MLDLIITVMLDLFYSMSCRVELYIIACCVVHTILQSTMRTIQPFYGIHQNGSGYTNMPGLTYSRSRK